MNLKEPVMEKMREYPIETKKQMIINAKKVSRWTWKTVLVTSW